MSTALTWQTNSTSSDLTEALAAKLGAALKGGEVIELVSDLGGGKTTFVRGLARGAGSQDKVASPTFTVSRVYRTSHFTIHHFDFYRLADPGIVANELAEVVNQPDIVVVVEWADVVRHVLPQDRLTIRFQSMPSDDRQLDFHAPTSLGYLMEAVR
jgi:tRNA threonylcarbamoyladenosine biosynthesis protein TsaE